MLDFSELLKQDGTTGAVTVAAHVVGGTGALNGVRGDLNFVGVSDGTRRRFVPRSACRPRLNLIPPSRTVEWISGRLLKAELFPAGLGMSA